MGTNWNIKRAGSAIVLLLIGLWLVAMPMSAMTPAGTAIQNQATATYFWDGSTHTALSPRVTVTVAPVRAVALSPTSGAGAPADPGFQFAHQPVVEAGKIVVLPYRLFNRGNASDTYDLTVEMYEAAGMAPIHGMAAVYHDVNGDGVIGAGDPPVTQLPVAAQSNASLLLRVTVPAHASGGDEYYVALGGGSVSDPVVDTGAAWAKIAVVDDGPVLSVHRSVSIAPIPANPPQQPGITHYAGTGAVLTHLVVIDNVGRDAAADARLTDALTPGEQLLLDAYGVDLGIKFNDVPLSLTDITASEARVETDAYGVQHVSVDLPSILVGQQIVMEYKTVVLWPDGVDAIVKTSEVLYEAQGGTTVTQRSNALFIGREATTGVVMRARGKQPGDDVVVPELTAGDATDIIVDVTNSGTVGDDFVLELISTLPAGWTVTYFEENGVTPLSHVNADGSVNLGSIVPGGTRSVVVRVTAPWDPTNFDDPPYVFDVGVRSKIRSGVTDALRISVDDVLELDLEWEPLRLRSNMESTVAPGTAITYLLEFGNVGPADAVDVVIRVELSELLENTVDLGGFAIADRTDLDEATPIVPPGVTPPVSPAAMSMVAPAAVAMASSPAAPMALSATAAMSSVLPDFTFIYDAVKHRLEWHIGTVPAGTGVALYFQGTLVDGVLPGSTIPVTGTLIGSGTSLAVETNTVTHVVVADLLVLKMSSDVATATIGDVVTLTADVENVNTVHTLHDTEVRVRVPSGLSYVPNSAFLDGGATPPTVDGEQLVFVIPELQPLGKAAISFATIVNAHAHADDVLAVRGQAAVLTAVNTLFTSLPDYAYIVMRGDIWGDAGIIVGRVVLDDEPLPGVRVVLDNGRFAITDQAGRYSFVGVAPGFRHVRLDEGTLPDGVYPVGRGNADRTVGEPLPESHPYRLRVVLSADGLAVAEFALASSYRTDAAEQRQVEEDAQ